MGFFRWFFLGFFGWVFLGGFFNANPVPDPRGPNPYGSWTLLVRKSCIEITPRMYNYRYTVHHNTYRGRAQELIINSTKTYFFAEPKLRFDARLARDESRSPVITWYQTHYSVFNDSLKVPSGQIGSAWEWYHWKAL